MPRLCGCLSWVAVILRAIALSWPAFGAVSGWEEIPGSGLDISAHAPATEIYRRAETRAGFQGLTQAFPQNLDTLAHFLARAGITSFDREALSLWETGFRKERLHWQDSGRGHSFFLRPEAVAGGLFSGGPLGDNNLTGVGLTVYGQALGRLAFYSHGMVYTQKTGKEQFSHLGNPDLGEAHSAEVTADHPLADARTFNRFEYYLKYQGKRITIKIGRDWMSMGPGFFSSLVANSDTPPYAMLEFRLDFAPWLYLDNYLVRMVDTDYGIQKYGHIHRFEFKPWPSLALGFQDMVIYQDRDPDARYLLPLAPLTFSEINNGGRDNSSMAFHFLWTSPWHASLWGEIFIDDLLGPTSFFDSWWENRWATLVGAQWVSPWQALDADLVIEYSHVEPWTYIGRQPQTSFKHFNTPSASKLGPDSRSWDLQAAWRPWKRLEWKERLEWNAKGTGRPATLGVVHADSLDGTGKYHLRDAKRSGGTRHSLVWTTNRCLKVEAFWRQGWGAGEYNEGGGVASLAW